MATADIYYARINCSTNNRAWGTGFYVEEQDPISAGGDGLTVAKAIDAVLKTAILDILSVDSRLESIVCSKRFIGFNPAGMLNQQTATGTRAGDSLPNDNVLYFNFHQTAFAAKHNGGLFWCGQSITDHAKSKWVAGYLSTQVAAMSTALLANFDAIGGEAGRWRLIILSKRLPFAMAIGTPIDVTNVIATDRVLTQSRRRQKVQGWST